MSKDTQMRKSLTHIDVTKMHSHKGSKRKDRRCCFNTFQQEERREKRQEGASGKFQEESKEEGEKIGNVLVQINISSRVKGSLQFCVSLPSMTKDAPQFGA